MLFLRIHIYYTLILLSFFFFSFKKV